MIVCGVHVSSQNFQIIKTLRDRLAAAEKQTDSVNLIVSTLKSNNQAHQEELRLADLGRKVSIVQGKAGAVGDDQGQGEEPRECH